MKTLVLTLLATTLSLLFFNTNAQASNEDGMDIIGTWYNTAKSAKVEIYEKEGLFYGKVIWLEEPLNEEGNPKRDMNNPDESKRERGILELVLLKKFKYNGDNVYKDGKIYDPENGKTYKCKMTLDGDNLKVRGFIGVSALGRTEHWTRAE